MKNLIINLSALLAFACGSYAQVTVSHVTNSTGGSFDKDNIVYEWSIGELALVNEMHSASGKDIITNGFLQPFSPKIPAYNNDIQLRFEEMVIYPNPTRNQLAMVFRSQQRGKIRMIMYDDLGYAVYKKEVSISGYETFEQFDMQHLTNGTYLLHVKLIPATGRPLKERIYKIIKIPQ